MSGRAVRSAVCGLAASIVPLLAAPPAWSHEIGLALVVESANGGAPGAQARDGFRLAVDQSPDVSHAPGGEAGDHLGGVDVDIAVVDTTDPVATRSQVARVVKAGATVVVVLAPSKATGEALRSADLGPETLLLEVGTAATGPARTGAVLTLRDRSGVSAPAATDRLERSFRETYGRPPSVWAVRGYDAAQVIDVAVGQLGPHARDAAAIAAAVNASSALVTSEVVTSEVVTSEMVAPDMGGLGNGSDRRDGSSPGPVVAIATVALVAAGTLALGIGRRRSRTS